MNPLQQFRIDNPDHKPVTKTHWEKLREKPTLRRAVTSMCNNCMGWDEDGARPVGVAQSIRECTATGCPLFGFRPHRGNTSP